MDIISAIQQKCKNQSWYGPQMGQYFQKMRLQHRWESTFSYAPATEKQLQATEQAIGYSLPPLLKPLYMQIANGGFGPGYGLRGALGGYTTDETIVDYYLSLAPIPSTCKEYEVTFEFSSEAWPSGFLPICPIGCGGEICISPAGIIYHVGPAHEDLNYIARAVFPSLESWLADWLTSDL